MRRLSTLLTATSLVALLAAPGAVSANQSIFGLGFHGGYGESADAESGSGRAGIHAEFRPFHSLGLVGSAGYVFEEDVLVTDTSGEEIGTFKAKNTPVTAMARLYLPVANFHPYAAAGASWNFLTYDTGDGIDSIQLDDDSETAFGWLLGAGAQLMLRTRWPFSARPGGSSPTRIASSTTSWATRSRTSTTTAGMLWRGSRSTSS